MRSPSKSQMSKFLRIWTFVLLLFVRYPFDKPAYAAFSTVDSCLQQPQCAGAISAELAPVIAAPTAEAGGAVAISATTTTGAITTTEAVAGVAVVGDVRLSGILAYHVWQSLQNGQAQERARQRYCQAYPNDWVCSPGGGQAPGVLYRITFELRQSNGWGSSYGPWRYGGTNSSPIYGPITGLGWEYSGVASGRRFGFFQFYGYNYKASPFKTRYTTVYPFSSFNVLDPGYAPTQEIRNVTITRADNKPEPGVKPFIPWKDWPQEKRSIAVATLKEPDWQEFIKSMPSGGRLIPGDQLKAPAIVLPGLATDNPDTPQDERLTKKIPGLWTVPSPYPDLNPTPSPSFSPSPTPPPPTNSADPPPNAPPPDEPSNPPDSKPGEVTSEILQEIHDTASSYNNLECVEFANEVEAYLREQGISGRRLKLDTTKQVSQDDYIIDDSFSESEAISTNGHHEGIAITINGEEKVFDNNHGDGVPTEQWKNNLTFHSKEFFGAQFRESGYSF